MGIEALSWFRARVALRPYLLLALGLAGCAGEGEVTGGGGGQFAAIQREIFDQSCVAAACHDSTTQAGGLSLVTGQSYANLVDVAPDNPVARADGLLRVEPFMPETSFLLRKLRGELASGEGSRMPLGAPPLDAQEIASIAEWILEGAPRDEAQATSTAAPGALP